MTIDAGGNVTGVAAGDSTISADLGYISVMQGTLCGGYSCPTSNPVLSTLGETVTATFSSLRAVVQGQQATVHVTLNPSPSSQSVTLTITTFTGTGAAVFSSNCNQSVNAVTSITVSQTCDVHIQGNTTSSTSDNMRLAALTPDGHEITVISFSVIWISITTIKTDGRIDDHDDDAAAEFFRLNNTYYLNSLSTAFDGDEIKAVVSPSN